MAINQNLYWARIPHMHLLNVKTRTFPDVTSFVFGKKDTIMQKKEMNSLII